MLCKKPYMKGVLPCGCGQCLPCRINRARLWGHRIMLETRAHEFSAFVTLTYRDEELSHISDEWNGNTPVVATLVRKDAQKWIKRLRKVAYGPIRYFLVGEYGDQTGRPHYHVALFGFPTCVYGRTRPRMSQCCGPCEMVRKSWGKGRIQLGELNKDSAQYIAGYVTKKWTKEDSWTKEKLRGRYPEFARMSLNPGIGATAIKNMINFTGPTRAGKYVNNCMDAPVVLRSSGSTLPLGRYLRGKWREALGRDVKTPEQILGQHRAELQKLYQEVKEKELSSGTPRSFVDPGFVYAKENKQKLKNLDAKFKIYANRRPL